MEIYLVNDEYDNIDIIMNDLVNFVSASSEDYFWYSYFHVLICVDKYLSYQNLKLDNNYM